MAPKTSRPGLSRERVVAAAVAVADAEGLEALSMRRLAAELGSAPMSPYRHVRDKDALLDLMLDAVYREVRLPAGAEHWRAGLAALAGELRGVLRRHPWVGWVLANRPPLGEAYLRCVDFGLGRLIGHGVPPAAAMRLMGVVLVYVTGFVTVELAEQDAERRTGVSDEAKRAGGAAMLPGLRERLPALGAWMEAVQEDFHDVPTDEDFAFGLARVLDGLELAVASASRRCYDTPR